VHKRHNSELNWIIGVNGEHAARIGARRVKFGGKDKKEKCGIRTC